MLKNEQEILTNYTSTFERPDDYYNDKTVIWANVCRFKDQCTALFDKRWQAAKEVIDLISEEIGINPETTGFYLYGLVDGSSPIVDKVNHYLDHRGDKAKLKRRIDELEKENQILRSLVGK